MKLIAASLMAFAVTWPVARFLSGHGIGSIALDIPNERSMHDRPVPRLGGVAMAAGIAAGWLLIGQAGIYRIGVLAAGLMLVSLVDDMRGLSIGIRLSAHALAALILLFALPLSPPSAYWLLLLPVVVWSTNLYNFMDGADGLAGGMTVIGFGCYAIGAWQSGDFQLSAASACVASSSLAFLFFNFHPARLFLGDSGAIPLGFLAAALGLAGWRHGDWNVWFPLLTFSPFVADASVTLVKRLVRGEKFWQPHKKHYYQKLVHSGLGHAGTCRVAYAFMIGASLVALWQQGTEQYALSLSALFWLAGLGGGMLLFDMRRD